MKIKVKSWTAAATWKWITNDDDNCGICRNAFEGCCDDCKLPGDECPLIWGKCTHCFHMHCILKWLRSDEPAKRLCPMCRQEWRFKQTFDEDEDDDDLLDSYGIRHLPYNDRNQRESSTDEDNDYNSTSNTIRRLADILGHTIGERPAADDEEDDDDNDNDDDPNDEDTDTRVLRMRLGMGLRRSERTSHPLDVAQAALVRLARSRLAASVATGIPLPPSNITPEALEAMTHDEIETHLRELDMSTLDGPSVTNRVYANMNAAHEQNNNNINNNNINNYNINNNNISSNSNDADDDSVTDDADEDPIAGDDPGKTNNNNSNDDDDDADNNANGNNADGNDDHGQEDDIDHDEDVDDDDQDDDNDDDDNDDDEMDELDVLNRLNELDQFDEKIDLIAVSDLLNLRALSSDDESNSTSSSD